MKITAQTFGIYLATVIIIGIPLGLLHVANTTNPITGAAFALGFSIRIFYVTIPLLVGVYFLLRKYSTSKMKGQEKEEK